MNSNILKSLLGGLIGTAIMTMMMYKGAPMMIGVKMDIAHRIGSMFGDSWILGMAMHWINGVLVFPILFTLVLSKILPGQPWLQGVLWAIILWLVAQTVLMPITNAGLFSSNIGGIKVVMASLMGHIVYGAILGSIAGGSKSVCAT